MSDDTLAIELARHQWEEGRRTLQRAPASSAPLLHAQVEVVSAEIVGRLGQVFTLADLVAVYGSADRWSLSAIHDAIPDGVPAQAAAVADAAFELAARRASDYRP